MERIWDQYLSLNDKTHIDASGHQLRGFGNRPALLMIDLYRWVFGDKPLPLIEAMSEWPGSCGLAAWDSLPYIQKLLATAREVGIPVVHVTGLPERESGVIGWSGITKAGEGRAGYMGDGNNIVNSWLQLATRFPMHFVCCGPEGYEPDSETVNMVNDSDLSSYELSHDPLSAVKDADIIYTDVWASMGQKEEAEERKKIFAPFQVNRTLIESTGKDTKFMHCLPAERGREVTDSVMESSNSIVFDQAENRMWAQMSLLTYFVDNGAWHAMGDMMGIGY